MSERNAASEAQFRAARPDSSTWLSANAGSGKTKVLTDRVARLLLKGVQPQHILCLTYTKAAASEMQNRLFMRLGEWAMLPDPDLVDALRDLGVDLVDQDAELSQARTLFARAIETPGGLKIQTIHSFCASLLRRFPLEAGVSPQFTEMEDRSITLLQSEIVEDLAETEPQLISALASHVSDTDFATLADAVAQKREHFGQTTTREDLCTLLELPPAFDAQELAASVFLGNESDLLQSLCNALSGGGTNDQKAAAKLKQISEPGLKDLPLLETVFLTGATAKSPFSAKLGSFPTKKIRSDHPDLIAQIEPFMLRVEAARGKRLSLDAVDKSFLLHRFASVFLPEYERRKQLRGWLDFDDLVLKARQLLNDPAVAAWVLYRLDGGIDHILVDEAQDTSPVQWDVIEKLAQEFTAGEGARSQVERTIFVVGDMKQSIYSFQGADPDAFLRMQSEFGHRLSEVGSNLQTTSLEYSFRSSAAILGLVDEIFKDHSSAGFHKDALHRAFKADLPGRVDIWPAVEKVSDDEDRHWSDPVDRPGNRHHTVILAEKIASEIKRMIDSKETIPCDGPERGTFQRRPVHPGDFLILVQRRSELFSEIIRACKAARLPIAGADRLKVGAELAVKDIAALLSFLATPEDSLSLAAALKSPLFGWSEQALFDLAHRRTSPYLWTALRDRSAEFSETMAVLNDLRDHTDFLRPFDLIERILTRHDGRRRLLGRLGAEAEDGINALLSQALAYERTEIPSLTGFLVWMQTDDLEIKRQMAAAGDMIRVMSVHGSKGLEAPIVILPDTAKRRAPPDEEIMLSDGIPLWKQPKEQMPPKMLASRELKQEKLKNERLRLLYVALTRAEKWLIVAAAGDLSAEGDSWYQLIEQAALARGAVKVADGDAGWRLTHGDWDGLERVEPPHLDIVEPSLPDMFTRPAPDYIAPSPTLSPSNLGGAKALPGEQGLDEDAAKERGTKLHLLFEHLPEHPRETWPEIAENIGVIREGKTDLFEEAVGVLTASELGHLFEKSTLVEVPVSASVGGHRIYGIIDRLIVKDEYVLAIDFKSNATVPSSPRSCPDGILRQMGAYVSALSKIYPDRKIETAIVWTRTAELMRLPTDLVTAAFFQRLEP